MTCWLGVIQCLVTLLSSLFISSILFSAFATSSISCSHLWVTLVPPPLMDPQCAKHAVPDVDYLVLVCCACQDGHILGIPTGGVGPIDEIDITFVTPYCWIEVQIKAKYAGGFFY